MAYSRTIYLSGISLCVDQVTLNLKVACKMTLSWMMTYDIEHNDRYHGRILLPAEYPFKPPELIFLTVSYHLLD